jgi:uncharacterized membrane protein YdcZ (DUF606 family)
MIATQVGIALFGVTAVFLSQDPRPQRQRWASVIGLLGQPFWFAETVSAQQWGMVALTVLYTWSWWRGFRRHWLRKAVAA